LELWGILIIHLVCLLGTCSKDGFIYIITEFIDGGCLRDFIQKVPSLSIHTIISMGLDIAKGMAWLHSRRPPIYHRDLHSRNVLVTSKGTCKVCDLGLSRVKGEVFHNTRLYSRIIPPELENSDFSNYSSMADVYMYGLVIYELITRKKADHLTNVNFRDLYTQVTDTMIPIVELMGKCIAILPEIRPTFQEIIFSLERIQQNLPEPQITVPPSILPIPLEETAFLPVESYYKANNNI